MVQQLKRLTLPFDIGKLLYTDGPQIHLGYLGTETEVSAFITLGRQTEILKMKEFVKNIPEIRTQFFKREYDQVTYDDLARVAYISEQVKDRGKLRNVTPLPIDRAYHTDVLLCGTLISKNKVYQANYGEVVTMKGNEIDRSVSRYVGSDSLIAFVLSTSVTKAKALIDILNARALDFPIIENSDLYVSAKVDTDRYLTTEYQTYLNNMIALKYKEKFNV